MSGFYLKQLKFLPFARRDPAGWDGPGEHDRADGRSDPAGIDPMDLDAPVLGRGGGACCKCHGTNLAGVVGEIIECKRKEGVLTIKLLVRS